MEDQENYNAGKTHTRFRTYFPQLQAPAAHPQSAQLHPSFPQPGMMSE